MRIGQILLYDAISLVLVVVAGHVYWCIVEQPYWKYSTQYEMIGSVIGVSGLCVILTVPLWIGRILLMIWSSRDKIGTFYESAISAVVYVLVVTLGVFRIAPLSNWDHHFGLLSVLLSLSALGCEACGILLGNILQRHV